MSEELLPCPWCGDVGQVVTHHEITSDLVHFREVQCTQCVRGVVGSDECGESTAIAAWNALPRTAQAAPSDREKRLEDLVAYVGSDHILGQLTRIFGSNQRELVELRRLLAALADTTTDEVKP